MNGQTVRNRPRIWIQRTFGSSTFRHHLGGCDRAVGREFLAQALVVDRVVQVLDVQVDTLVTVKAFDLHLFKFATEFRLALVALLGAADEQSLAVHVLRVHLVASLLGRFRILVTDEAEASRFALITRHDLHCEKVSSQDRGGCADVGRGLTL